MKASWRETDQENPPAGAGERRAVPAAAGERSFIGTDPSTRPGHARPGSGPPRHETGPPGTRLARYPQHAGRYIHMRSLSFALVSALLAGSAYAQSSAVFTPTQRDLSVPTYMNATVVKVDNRNRTVRFR